MVYYAQHNARQEVWVWCSKSKRTYCYGLYGGNGNIERRLPSLPILSFVTQK